MGAIIILNMTMKYDTITFSSYFVIICFENQLVTSIFFSLKNVDTGAAKELMAYLVKLQSSLSEVNQYVNFSTLTIEAIWFTQLRKES